MPRTTGIKHLYKAMALRTELKYRAATMAVIGSKYGLSPEDLTGRTIPQIVAMMDEVGDIGFSTELTCINTLLAWQDSGCQVFSLKENVLDLLACTAAPELNEIAPMSGDYMTDDECRSAWNIPYPAFAIELPYATSTPVAGGLTEYFSVAVATPFANVETKKADWSLTYLTVEDVADLKISMANGTSAINSLLTNLCLFINEGGNKSKASKRIGYDKAAKKADTKVNIWNVNMTTSTDIPLGIAREYIESGEAPPSTFRIGKRFMVRGHWRNQPCGPANSERVRRWIKPHLKGPDDGEAFTRVYKVGK